MAMEPSTLRALHRLGFASVRSPVETDLPGMSTHKVAPKIAATPVASKTTSTTGSSGSTAVSNACPSKPSCHARSLRQPEWDKPAQVELFANY